jgi:hypothetical protein
LRAIIPTDGYLDELRKRVCGDSNRGDRYEDFVTMIAEAEEKIELCRPQEEVDALAKQVRNAQNELDYGEGIEG